MDADLQAAVALRDQGRAEEARERMLALLERDPDNAILNYQCAWTHDKLGLEAEAVVYYEKALSKGLEDDDLRGAMLGLGSTYRALGRYDDAVEFLTRARGQFPERHEFAVFLAMALYNTGDRQEACRLLLQSLAETSSDHGVQRYREAILFYADHLDETW